MSKVTYGSVTVIYFKDILYKIDFRGIILHIYQSNISRIIVRIWITFTKRLQKEISSYGIADHARSGSDDADVVESLRMIFCSRISF